MLPAVDLASAEGNISGSLGTLDIALATLAYAGPLAAVSGYLSVVIGMGNGIGAPDMFIFMTLVMLVFAAGYCAFTQYVPNPGGFYAFISAGLGNAAGLGSALFTLATYAGIGWGFYAFAGIVSQQFLQEMGLGTVPWWACALAYWVVVAVLAYFHIAVSARVLGVLLLAEVLVVIVWDGIVIAHGGAHGLSTVPFHLSSGLSGNLGIAALFGTGFYTGFEATAMYREEARQPHKTIPRATYLVVIFIGLFYTLTSWVYINALGVDNAVRVAAADPANTFITLARQYGGKLLVDIVNPLLLTSVFAAHLSIQNVTTRYVYSLSVDGIFPKFLSVAHSKHRSPHRSSVLVSLIYLVGTAVLFATGMTAVQIYSQYAGLAQLGITVAMALTSLAAFVYFLKNKKSDRSKFVTIVCPLLAFLALCTLGYLGVTNLSTLTGASDLANWLMVGGMVSVWVVGCAYALWLKKNRPMTYRKIGRNVISD